MMTPGGITGARGLALAALLLLAGVAPAAAQSPDTAPAPQDRWVFRVAPYLWATAMDGNARVGRVEADVDVPFSDILKDLSFGAMLAADAQRGKIGIGVNALYARVSPDNEVGPIEIDTTSDTVQLAVAPYYRIAEWTYRTSSSGKPLRLVVEPEAGFRYTYLRAELEVRGIGRSVDKSENWVDPIVGSRLGLDLADRWSLAAEANIGGFGVGSDFAWNAQAVVGYQFTVFGVPTTLAAGYRALHQDYDHNDFKWDVTMHGPVLGTVLRF
jgi:hypothetical protein